ncbi:IS3 family transposase [Cupriavidus sp. D39]|uniref:IS3 family transposase n=1 Tax=Cupriavidus sp. D39 TaxID=2997877 RepID=UPI0022700A37|nr:IS3 family transposase [Cupriavidus sp. D39]MCY0857241.1 IS3 family transposase [Cupriavidus sp. D39]MCY0857249.1 IS3 family transposase [Cupriavidus sp. D39]
MKRYTAERREWAVEQMMPPLNRSVVELAKATGITTVTLRTWREMARAAGRIVPGDGKQSDQWSSADKFRVVLETAPLSEAELSEYCRMKGIQPEQIRQWREACEQANAVAPAKRSLAQRREDEAAQKRVRELERELKRKNAALAETAALLVLQKSRSDLGTGRGRLISTPDRFEAIQLIDEAVSAGARQAMACEALGLTERTLQRWRHAPADKRLEARRDAPANKLSEAERQALLTAANQPGYASLTPHQIVPKLADEGIYLASESTFYRVLKAAGQGRRRGRSKAPSARPLTTHRAEGPNQVWCWDITWLPTTVKGRFFYWYMMKDIYSRKLVANEVHESESAEHASRLLMHGCLREQTAGRPLVLHSDNGTAMKGASMLATMYDLGVVPSYSRPRVSNDNAYAEALFRTAKYCPLWPERPFESLEQARAWVLSFVRWYNDEHRHSSLKYVTPSQRHQGKATALLAQRTALYQAARARNPQRWAAGIRNWQLVDAVYLNPERAQQNVGDCKKAA